LSAAAVDKIIICTAPIS